MRVALRHAQAAVSDFKLDDFLVHALILHLLNRPRCLACTPHDCGPSHQKEHNQTHGVRVALFVLPQVETLLYSFHPRFLLLPYLLVNRMSQRLREERASAIQNKSKWRLVGFIVGGVAGAVLLLGLVGLVLILHTTPPPVIHTDPGAAQRLQRELQDAQSAAERGTPGVVGADEKELNSMLKEYLQASNTKGATDDAAALRDMRMSLVEDRLRLYVLVNLRGRDITLSFEGKLRTLNGYLDFEPMSGKIGSLPIPKASLKRTMEQMLATPEGRESARLPRNLHDLHIENGKLVLVFR